MPRRFWDTYGMVEYSRGSAAYLRQESEAKVATGRLNLMEAYYILLRREGKPEAEAVYEAFRPFAVEPSDATVKRAMEFRLRMRAKRKRLSYADALGYQTARDLGIPFLTGDPDLRGLPGVTFLR